MADENKENEIDTSTSDAENIETSTDTKQGSEKDTSVEDAGGEKKAQQQRTVPLAALHEERERRKKAETEAKDFRSKQEVINKRLASLFSDEPEQKEVKFEENPAIFLKKQVDENVKETNEIKGFFQQQKAMQELGSYASSAVATFKKDAPDYDAAYEYVRRERVSDIMETEECDEATAVNVVNQEELAFTLEQARKGKNPAKALYAYAKRRGYKPTESNEGEKKLENIQRGLNGSKSLSSASGKSPSGLTAEALAAMSDEEFSEFKAKNPRKFREIMGAVSA